jgi:predicted RNA binding protein YcfA (HicA-like mRNA interferase family)
MKVPRDLSAGDLAKTLARFGYEVTRQKGSHLRLTTQTGGEHHVTLPNHSSLRIGVVSSVLADVASHLGISRDQLVRQLFE